MDTPKYHGHPYSLSSIFGVRIMPGMKLAENDVCASPNGRWEKCTHPGMVLEEGDTSLWVRPRDTKKH